MSEGKKDGTAARGLAVVILAAGKGTRLKSKRPKVLHAIGGKPLAAHVIAVASRMVAPEDIYVIVGHEAERVQHALKATGVRFVEQAEQRGTGHALQCARQAMEGYENVVVLSGDVPLIRPQTLERLWHVHEAEQAALTLVTARPEDATGYGRVVRTRPGEPGVEAIVEQKSLAPGQEKIGEINAGIYAFRTAPLLKHMNEMKNENAQGEFYLTDMAAILHGAGERVVAVEATDAGEVLGANTIAELVALDARLRAETAARLMDEGVTIFRPETCVIDAEVEVGPDTVIEPYVQLLGATRIGSGCTIRSFTVIENCTLGEGVLVQPGCMLEASSAGDGARIGPFTHFRPGAEIGPEVHVGNFVEIKKSRLGKGTKANHLTYIGDADIGERTNIGAGTITCNYDGVNKFVTQIGDGVFIGSDSTLVAPVRIEDGAYIGAATCITRDVPADALAVGRARQVTKEGWAAARRARRSNKE